MEYTLIHTVIGSLVMAFIFGMIAKKLGLPTILGYLLAGMAIGPYTPGFVADISLARQLAEIGIILLMFGVGLHFSFSDLLRVRRVALPGALFQMTCATAIGAGLANMLGYSLIEGIIFGVSLSVASTIVLIRALEQRGDLETKAGKIAVGWLIIEDIAMVLALVLLPVMAELMQGDTPAGLGVIITETAVALIKITAFICLMALIARRVLPKLLTAMARMHSQELETVGILAIALGFAFLAYTVFDASFALGAFLAGMMLNESEIGRKSAESTLPIRDAFSVLFFVSVGMLFNPHTLVEQPLPVLYTFMVIVFAKGLAALAIAYCFSQSRHVCFSIAIGLAQIGEFSFILGSVALTKNLINADLYSLILAGAMLSILANPFLFRLYDRVWPR